MDAPAMPTRCFQCKGPYHEATGQFYAEYNIVFCGACYKPFTSWLRGHLKRKWSKGAFYEEALTSVVAGGRGKRGLYF